MAKTTNDGSKGGILSGNSHANGGMPATVVSTGQNVELEGGELIINKKSANSDKEYTVKGTPKEIASAINSVDGNGVRFDGGAEMTDHQTGETKVMKEGGVIESINEYLWFLNWHKNI